MYFWCDLDFLDFRFWCGGGEVLDLGLSIAVEGVLGCAGLTVSPLETPIPLYGSL